MGGPLAVVDVKKMEWLGMVNSLSRMRHIIRVGNKLYMSCNASGEVYSMDVDSLLNAVRNQRDKGKSFTVNGIEKVKVGGGARTLKASPDGKYLFVACNTASSLYVVDAEQMKVLGNIRVDSYPVGLDVSPDGRYVIVTSQGRKGGGGNAVNIFEVIYPKGRPEIASAYPLFFEDGDELAEEIIEDENKEKAEGEEGAYWKYGAIAAGVILMTSISGSVYSLVRKRS